MSSMPNSSHSTVFVGRQQIYDSELNVAAYELLFRSSQENRASIIDGDAATSQLLISAILEIGLENLAFGRPAFVNFTRNFLLGKCEIPLDPEGIVIEVLETVEPDEDVITSLKALRKSGYTIALDDYVDSDHREQLLELADIVKIDLTGYEPGRLADEVRRLKKRPLKLLAEKVETNEEFQHCKDLGFDYFQGYFLSRPQVIEGKAMTSNRLSILQLLVKLRDPAVTFDELVEFIKRDIPLSFKLLRYVNSLAYGARHQIHSVRQAAVRLGLQKISQIVSLIALGGISDKPKSLFETALVRAKMCELLGILKRPEIAESCFTVGLFSSLDAFLDQPLKEILNEIAITPEIREALLSQQGLMGRLLSAVISFERGDWSGTQHLGIDESRIQRAYLDAAFWAHQETQAAYSENA